MAWILWGLLFGSIGTGYLVYGKKQHAPVPLLCGITLIAFPYFVTSVLALVLVGAVLVVLPFVVRP